MTAAVTASDLTRRLAAVLRGDRADLGDVGDAARQAQLLDASADHAVDGLVRRALRQRGTWPDVPSPIRSEIDHRVCAAGAAEVLRCRELTRAVSGLRAAGVEALVLKGAALAHTLYPAPHLRPSVDIDLLVRTEDRSAAAMALEALGYTRRNAIARDAVHAQATYERTAGSVGAIDLHWSISNRPLFAETLTFDELASEAVPVPGFGGGVRTPGPVHALLLACVHRVAHHGDPDRLIWLYDIKLLAAALSPEDWRRFASLAARKRIAAVCRHGLAMTAALLGCGEGASAAIEVLDQLARTQREPSAVYIGGIGGDLRLFALDLYAARGPRAKADLVASHLFPDARYMRLAFGATTSPALAAAYIRRAARGLWRLVN